jgi:ClpX C4-type zinc finger
LKSGRDAKLVAGAGGFICKECAISAMGIFNE